MPKIQKEAAAKFLSDVSELNKFWCNDGKVFSNLSELLSGLKTMSAETFSYHVNSEKNDFSNWIYDIIGDTDLANQIRGSKDKKAIENKVKNRINALKK